jgi:hypothetical protein
MFFARILLVLAAAAVTALAMTVSTAAAQDVEVVTEPGGEHCSDVSIVGHVVSGGCHLEGSSSGDVTLHVYIPNKVTISSCEVSLEGRTNGNAEGYITEAILDPPHSGSVPCTRQPCEETTTTPHEMIPWPAHLREDGPASEEIRTEFCIVGTSSEGIGSWCELHSSFLDLGGHQYQLGGGQEEFCENNPGGGYAGPHAVLPAPTSIEAQIQTSGGDEGVELVH